jgi:hypothetical protein
MTDYITARERLTPPSRLAIWLEERVLQHRIAVERKQLQDDVHAHDTLGEAISKRRDRLHKMLDWQKKRGFEEKERLSLMLTLCTWNMLWGVLICYGALNWFWFLTH